MPLGHSPAGVVMGDWLQQQADKEARDRLYPRRYFVVFKRLTGSTVETCGKRIGWYANFEDANRQAQKRFSAPGITIVEVKPESRFQLFAYAVERFVIRSLRIAAGVAVAIVGWTLLFDSSHSIANIPIGQMTLGMLVTALFKGIVAVIGGFACWALAFGEGTQLNKY